MNKIALLHRYPESEIPETNAAFGHLMSLSGHSIDVLTFRTFNRINALYKLFKSLLWLVYAPLLVAGKGYSVIYCDDSFPLYALFVRWVCPKARIIQRLGDIHVAYYFRGVALRLALWVEARGWAACDELIPVTSTMVNFVRHTISAHKLKMPTVTIVEDPVDTDLFKPKPSEGLMNTANVIAEPTRPLIVTHGLLTKNKRVDMLLTAAKILDEYDFLIIGAGPELSALKRKAPANVTFTGWLPRQEMADRIASAWVGVAMRQLNCVGNDLVLTSPFLQFWASGVPCVASDREALRDMIYPDGMLYWDIISLVKALRRGVDCYRKNSNLPKAGRAWRYWTKRVSYNNDSRMVAGKLWQRIRA